MSATLQTGGVRRQVSRSYVFGSGKWLPIMMAYVFHNGAWRRMDTLNWSVGGWSGCSTHCGGGTQTRSVLCLDSMGRVVPDLWCSRFAGVKPTTVQNCNAQACSTTYYSRSNPRSYCRNCRYTTQFYWNGSLIASGTTNSSGQWAFDYRDVGQWRYSRGNLRENVSKDCSYIYGVGDERFTYYVTGKYHEIIRTQLW